MKFQHVPASRGALWVRQGLAAFATRPLAFSGLLGLSLFASFALAFVPLLGPFLLLGMFPLLSLGFMIATRMTLAGQVPLPTVFMAPLRVDRQRRRAQLWLYAGYALAAFLIWLLTYTIAGSRMIELQQLLYSANTTPEMIDARLSDGHLQLGMLVLFVLSSVLSVVWWHAPGLVHWGGMSASKSLFFSLVACWRNRGAFVIYMLVWFGAVLAAVILVSLVSSLLGQVEIGKVLMLPVWLMVMSAFYASLFFTFADSFELESADTGSPPP
jgi:hypothetical protein